MYDKVCEKQRRCVVPPFADNLEKPKEGGGLKNPTPTSWRRLLKVSVIDTNNSIYKMLISEFDISDIRSGLFCALSIISLSEKIERCIFWINVIM